LRRLDAMPKYTMQTMGGLAPSAGVGVAGAQGAVLSVRIQKNSETDRAATYSMIGGGGGLGPKGGVSIALGPQSPSEFDSPVQQADLFWGTVRIVETGIQLLVGNVGYSDMVWLTGPAEGTKCAGFGYGLCAGLSATAGGASLLMLKFQEWGPPLSSSPTRQSPRPTQSPGRDLQQ
jgi:hypothetical protein